jgi:hypothetical protein
MSTNTPRARVSSLVELLGLGVSGLACSMPSATIELPQAPSEDQQAAQGQAKQAQRPTKTTRKAAAPGRRPTVLEAELLGEGEHLRLHFSEPLGPTDGVDPNDFRLSVAMAYAYKTYAYAYYYDPGLTYGEASMTVTTMRGQGDTLELYIDPPFPVGYCQELQRDVDEMRGEPGIRANGGLFLHYAPGDTPITDPQGNQMAAIAAQWVLQKRGGGDSPDEMYFEGPPARRALRDPIPVRCGPLLPPGPR